MFLDIVKAFHKVEHKGLLWKLMYSGLPDVYVLVTRSYRPFLSVSASGQVFYNESDTGRCTTGQRYRSNASQLISTTSLGTSKKRCLPVNSILGDESHHEVATALHARPRSASKAMRQKKVHSVILKTTRACVEINSEIVRCPGLHYI